MHEVLVNRLGGPSLPRKSVVRLTDRPDMTFDVYRGRKTTIQQQQQHKNMLCVLIKAILMYTHNILFSILKKKLTLNYLKSTALGFFPRDSKQVRHNRGKRGISVLATEGLLYFFDFI